MAGLLESIGGVVPAHRAPAPWCRDGGSPPTEDTDLQFVAATGKLTQKANHTSVEAAFLARHAPGQFKITMMSSSTGPILWDPQLSTRVHPAPPDLVRDLVALQIAEIERPLEQGVTWIQLDSLGYNQVFGAQFRAATGVGHLSPEMILDATIAVDTAVVGAAKRKNPAVTVAMHICRGNNRSAWMAEGSYEPIAERLFGAVGVDRFLLEYEDPTARVTGRATPARPPGQFRAQPVRVTGVAQVEQAVEASARHLQPAGRRPGGQQEPVVPDPPAVGEGYCRVVHVQVSCRDAQFQLHVVLGVPVPGDDGEVFSGRGPRQVPLGQRRPLVGHLRLGPGQHDAVVAAGVAQGLCGAGACHPAAHDHVCVTCHGLFLLSVPGRVPRF